MDIARDTALVLIDVQKGFDDPKWGSRNNPDAEENMGRILRAWRAAGRPVIHVQHASRNAASPLHPDRPGFALKEVVAPAASEPVFRKDVNSALIGTGLEGYLREQGLGGVLIVGLTTNHCVSTTARMAGNLGFDTWVVADATATFDRADHTGRTYSAQEIHDVSLASLHDEFATVTTTDDVLRAIGAPAGP